MSSGNKPAAKASSGSSSIASSRCSGMDAPVSGHGLKSLSASVDQSSYSRVSGPAMSKKSLESARGDAVRSA
jgi:hypothetical protein